MSTHIEKVSILGKERIHCGFHLIPYLIETVLSTLPSSNYVLFTDTTLANLYAAEFESCFSQQNSSARWLLKTIPPGEQSKSRQVKADLEDFLLEQKCTRDTVILALGGGVVGDLVGFVAATFMRGVRYCQIPTTLLAMVDSAVGGKTAIDTPAGKNLIGAFHQPEYIFIDASFLETLPRREFINGMAEVIKTAAIWDETEFASLEAHQAEIHAAVLGPSTRTTQAGRTLESRTSSQALLLSVIRGSIAVKSHIVTIDEKETGLRNLVNFGHTVGHAIEAIVTPDVLHGECVAVGMILEAEISRALGHLGNAAVGRLTRCLKAHGCPVTLQDSVFTKTPRSADINVEALLDYMKIDKKNSGAEKKIVLLSRIGKTLEEKATAVSDEIIASVLSPAVFVNPGPPKSHFTLATPGSKSISNRALVLAALGKGRCNLSNLLHSDDTQVMMSALEDMKGAQFSWEDNGETMVVIGGEGSLSPPKDDKHLYLGNAGTASRFLTTVCALVTPDTNSSHTIITGNARMKQRPIGPLVDALRSNDVSVEYLESENCLPLKIKATSSGFKGGKIQLAASVSSQYVSSILLCAPYAKEEVVLELVGGVVISQPYIDLTIAMMETFGIKVERMVIDGVLSNTYRIPQGIYINPPTYHIESDASSATYPLAIAAITGTTCTLQNIGFNSLQGDARFAKDVLEPMGCKVVQTELETIVTGPPVGQLRALGVIDMEPMTDAFLTASVLAAVATQPPLPGRAEPNQPHNSTKIHGIANQRVKECNRIAAMRTQLLKFGVQTNELEDGIEVLGIDYKNLSKDASVHCYDDHRVAMSFSVLAAMTGGPGAIIEEKRCVEKTWPSWWDDLSNKIGITYCGVELNAIASSSTPNVSERTSIFILGMRGAGKTHISKIGALALGWEVIDADALFKTTTGLEAKDFVAANDWNAFRDQETVILRDLISDDGKEGRIVSLGGGVVEREENRALLEEYAKSGGSILFVQRDIEDIVRYLSADPTRPSLGEDLHDIYDRRKPLYEQLASYVFWNTAQEGSEDQITRFFKFIGGQTPTLDFSRQTFILEVDDSTDFSQEKIIGVDALQVRAKDLSIVPTLTVIRQSSSLPIVFSTQSSVNQETALQLLSYGLKSGCEYIDAPSSLSDNQLRSLSQRASTTRSKLIVSHYANSSHFSWLNDAPTLFNRLSKYADVVRIVVDGGSDHELESFRTSLGVGGVEKKPFAGYNEGPSSQLSKILNRVFSPVSLSQSLGSLSFEQYQQALTLLGRVPSKQFFLFGTPIQHSKSPLLHNTAFKSLSLPYKYSLLETSTIDDSITKAIRDPNFGGASVTIPHKLEIMKLLDEVSSEAHIIGAVNTIIPFQNGSKIKLRGTNTDWLGFKEIIDKRLLGSHAIGPESTALVLGAGGTCRAAIYALFRSGFKTVHLYNRTLQNATAVASSFSEPGTDGLTIIPIDSLDAFSLAPGVIISTIPAHGVSTPLLSNPEAGVFVPASIFARKEKGVFIDAAYKPKRTPLVELAEKEGWAVGIGIEMLIEQGIWQNRMWTGRDAPKTLIERVVMTAYESEE